jgi:hypothetical protein
MGKRAGQRLLTSRTTGLPKESVANTSQVFTFDKTLLVERVSKLPRATVGLLLAGIDRVLGRQMGNRGGHRFQSAFICDICGSSFAK